MRESDLRLQLTFPRWTARPAFWGMSAYFYPIDLMFFIKMLTGWRVIEVFLSRDASFKEARVGTNFFGRALLVFSRPQIVVGCLMHGAILMLLLMLRLWPVALGWGLGVGVVFPLFGALRQILEHRSLNAGSEVDYHHVDHGAVSRVFGSDLFSVTFGGAGFNRHLLHHWEPSVSYTRLKDLEIFLSDTELAPILAARRTSYWRALAALMTPRKTENDTAVE